MQSRQFFIVCHHLFSLLCFIGVFCNFLSITLHYFSYPVYDDVSPFVPFDLPMPSFSLCFSLDTILAEEPENSYFFKNYLVYGRSIGHLKNATPPVDQVLLECAYRDWWTDSVVTHPPGECLEHFKIEKYIIQRLVCYKFEPPRMNYSFYHAISSLERRRLLYRVSIAPPLNKGHRICPMIHFSHRPLYEQLFSQDMLPSVDGDEIFWISYASFTISNLPAPYASRCEATSETECFLLCASKLAAEHGYAHYSGIYSNNDSLRIPNLKSPEVIDSIMALGRKWIPVCDQRCQIHSKCEMNLAVTSAYVSPPKSPHKLTFEVQTLDKPAMRVKTHPDTDLIAYFTQVTSVFSFWLGFSVLGLLGRWRKQPSPSVKSMCVRLIRVQSHLHALIVQLNALGFNVSTCMKKKAARNRSKNNLISIASLVVKSVAIAGFSTQIYNVMNQYFKYETFTDISFLFNPKVTAPNINLCIPIDQSLSADHKYVATTRFNYEAVRLDRASNSFFEKPLSSLMNDSPSTEQMLLACRLPSNNTRDFQLLRVKSKDECLRNFETHRYYIKERVCYNLRLNRTEEMMKQSKLKLLMENRGIFYTLVLTKRALKYKMEIILTDQSIPVMSRHYATILRKTNKNRLNILTTFQRTMDFLPPPYDTGCDPSQDRGECTKNCLMNRTLVKLDQFAYSELITERNLSQYPSVRVISFHDLTNESIGLVWRDIERQCNSACFRPKCHTVIIKTFSSHGYRSDFANELAVGSRASPDQLAKANPRSSLSSVFYQVFCCANFWLGLVILDVSWFKLKVKALSERLIDLFNRKVRDTRSLLLVLQNCIDVRLGRTCSSREMLKNGLIEMSRMKEKMIRSSLIKSVTCICCFVHLFLCLDNYLQYPTFSDTDYWRDKSTDYELSVCNSYVEERSPSLLERYGTGRISRQQLDDALDEVLQTPIKEVLEKRSPDYLQLNGCSFRGLKLRNNLSEHMKDLTDRLIFREDEDPKYCRSIFTTEVFLINGLICHRFIQNIPSRSEGKKELSSSTTIFSVSVNSDHLTPTLSVMVADRNVEPYTSSYWSPLVYKPREAGYFQVSFIKYRQTILPAPYFQGFTNAISMRCMYWCWMGELKSYGFAAGAVWTNSSNHFMLKSQMKQSITKRRLKDIYGECKRMCEFDIQRERAHHYFVTTISEAVALGHRSKAKRIEFLLTKTEFPFISVRMKAQWSLFELFISLGSILNIWFGLCALSLDPRRSESHSPDHECLNQCELCLQDLLCIEGPYTEPVSLRHGESTAERVLTENSSHLSPDVETRA